MADLSDDLDDEQLAELTAAVERYKPSAMARDWVLRLIDEIKRRRAEDAALSSAPMPPGLDERLMVRRREAQVVDAAVAEQAALDEFDEFVSAHHGHHLDVDRLQENKLNARRATRDAVDALLTAREAARAFETEGDDE